MRVASVGAILPETSRKPMSSFLVDSALAVLTRARGETDGGTTSRWIWLPASSSIRTAHLTGELSRFPAPKHNLIAVAAALDVLRWKMVT
jgi:hypothetical protein